MAKFPKTAFIISLSVHLAIIAAAFVLPKIFFQMELPGPGDEVIVLFVEPAGDVAFGPSHAAKMRKAARHKGVVPESLSEVTAIDDRGSGHDSGEDMDDISAGGVQATGGPGTSPGHGGSDLLSQIWSKVNASKYYPASARRNGITGSPKVSFAIDREGSVKWVKLVRSSGRLILDEAALKTVRRSTPLPYYPKPITVIIKYSLTN